MTYVVDSHIHILTPQRLVKLVKWMHKIRPDHPVPVDISVTDMLIEMKETGVTHFFNLVYPILEPETDPLNNFNKQFTKAIPGCIPFVSLHPDTENKAENAEALLDQFDVAGYKFHPFVQKFDPWDEKMDSLYRVLQERQKSVLFHTGFEDFYQMKMPLASLEMLLKKYPDLPFMFAHMCYPYVKEALQLLDDYPNLYLDATLVPGFLKDKLIPFLPPGYTKESFRELLYEGFTKHQGRILHGTDHPAGWGTLKEIFQDLDRVNLPETVYHSLKSEAALSFAKKSNF